jgi:hypothetical protein
MPADYAIGRVGRLVAREFITKIENNRLRLVSLSLEAQRQYGARRRDFAMQLHY